MLSGTFPFLAIAVLIKLVNNEIEYADFFNGLKWSTIICGGIALFFGILGGVFFDFSAEKDLELAKQIPEWMMEAIRSYHLLSKNAM